MSEVYIRSQNKEKLYRLGGNYACVEYGEYEDVKKKRGGAEADKKRHVICISDGCLEEIGEYATKERCLEVLDEIQKACVKAIKGYYVDKNSVSMGVHSPEYYGYGYLRYTLVKITDRGGLKCR